MTLEMGSLKSDRLERAAVYQLLARLWAEEPRQLLAELNDEPLRSAWQELGCSLPSVDSEDSLPSLDEDYCRLFVGPKGHLPPVQSVWMSGELDTGVTASLREFDSVVGFDEPWSFAIIPDHLGNEMWAMGQILQKSQDLADEELSVAADLASQFFGGHLEWAERFLKAVEEREGDQFYGTIASVTLRFLNDEATRLGVAKDAPAV